MIDILHNKHFGVRGVIVWTVFVKVSTNTKTEVQKQIEIFPQSVHIHHTLRAIQLALNLSHLPTFITGRNKMTIKPVQLF